jgi:hypothetical protein
MPTLPLADVDSTYLFSRAANVLQLLIVVAGGLSFPIIMVLLQQRAKREVLKAWHEQRMAAIEKGVELPPLPEALLNGSHPKPAPGAPASRIDWSNFVSQLALLFGLIALGLGLGLHIAYSPSGAEFDPAGTARVAHRGTVIALVGVGLLVYKFLTRQRKSEPA